jgi:hypothetical protein
MNRQYACLLKRASVVRDVLDWSASDNVLAPSLPIVFTVMSENEMKNKVRTAKIESCKRRI